MLKFLCFLCFILFLTSCSNIDASRIAPGYAEAFKVFDKLIFGYEDLGIDRQVIDKIPYASSLVRIGNGPQGLAILESKKDATESWVSSDQVYLIIRHGKIIRSSGLPNNLTHTLMPSIEEDFLKKQNTPSFYYLSYDKPLLRNLKVEVKVKIIGQRELIILGEKKKVTLYEEELENREIRWKRINKYWIDDDDFVWKSEQYISPKLPKIVIEVTKKPS